MISATPAWVALLVTGNAVGLLAGLVVLGLWIRRQFRQHVSDPISKLQSSVDNLTSNDAVLQTEVADVKALALKAHDRIDAILQGSSNA